MHLADSRIRAGKPGDLPAIGRLLQRAHAADGAPRLSSPELDAIVRRGELVVLPGDAHELAAAACVAPGRGLVFLVLDPAVASPELERRLMGVADALCESARPRIAAGPL